MCLHNAVDAMQIKSTMKKNIRLERKLEVAISERAGEELNKLQRQTGMRRS
jgi:hypothetical protein